jgi:hypothetical protein
LRKLGPGAPAGAFSAFEGTHWLIENGHREVSKKAAVRYARFFRVDLDWLLTGKGVGTGVTPPPPQDGTPPPITDATLTEIWSQLSERNRRKLVQIALILSAEG